MGEENRLLEELALYEEQCGCLEEQVVELSGRLSPDCPAGELENALEPYVQYVRTFDIINRRAEGSTRIGFLMRFFDEELVDALAEHRIQEREDTAVEPQAGGMAAGAGSAVKAMSAGLVKPAEMDGSSEAETAATDVDAGDLEAADETEVDAVVGAETVGVPGEGTLELGEPGEDVLELDEPGGGMLELGECELGEAVLELVGPDEEALELDELGEEDLELGDPDEEDL